MLANINIFKSNNNFKFWLKYTGAVIVFSLISALLMAVVFKEFNLVQWIGYWQWFGSFSFITIVLLLTIFNPVDPLRKMALALCALLIGSTGSICFITHFDESLAPFVLVHINWVGVFLVSYALNRKMIKWLVLVLIFSMMSATFFSLMNNTALYNNFIFSCFLALCDFYVLALFYWIFNPEKFIYLFGISAIIAYGFTYLATILFYELSQIPMANDLPAGLAFYVTVQVMAIVGFRFWWKKVKETEYRIEQEKLGILEIEKKIAETHYMILQAQLEPSFLFNTLKDILRYLDQNVAKAKSMQIALIQYLRTSLPQIRMERSTFAQEIKMTCEILDIFKVKLSDEMNYQVEMPDQLKSVEIPPMLFLPVVEYLLQQGMKSDKYDEQNQWNISISVNTAQESVAVEFRMEVDNELDPNRDYGKTSKQLLKIEKRLKRLYGNGYEFDVFSDLHQGIGVRISIPRFGLNPQENVFGLQGDIV